ILFMLIAHVRRRLAVVPVDVLGRGQLLYLLLLWIMVVGNLMRAIPPFQETRLITEGVIHVNAVVCTLLILLWPRSPAKLPDGPYAWHLRRVAVLGTAALALTVAGTSVGTRLIHGSAFVGHAGYHTRFGPDAQTGKPQKGL